MKPTQKIIKVNDSNNISILTFENGTQEMAHMVNGEISYKYNKDVIQGDEDKINQEVAGLVSEIVADFFDGNIECDEQAYMEFFTYTVWVAVEFDGHKLNYLCSTVHQENFDKDETALGLNESDRKTWKGLTNYINRFDV